MIAGLQWKNFKGFQGKIFQLKFFISIFFLGGSESSWDKDKIQSPLAAPGPQHGIAHAALTGQPSLGSAPTLNPLQQNHLLSNRKCTILTKLLVRKIDKWTKKMWYTTQWKYTYPFLTVKSLNWKINRTRNIFACEVTQTQKDSHDIYLIICGY